MDEKIILFATIALSALFALAALALSFLLAPKSTCKPTTYECGMEPKFPSQIQFDAKFFMCAILFLIFDIETVLLFPFALAYSILGYFALFEVVIFVLILTYGLVYAIKRGLIKWA